MGETERHIMAPFAQPLGLIDCLACTAAAVAGRGNDDYAHDVLSFGALCVKRVCSDKMAKDIGIGVPHEQGQA